MKLLIYELWPLSKSSLGHSGGVEGPDGNGGGWVETRFLYDGATIIGEYDGSGTLLRRTVQGPGLDEPLVTYDGAGTTNPSWLIADQLGSVIAATNSSAVATTINTYDAFGQGAASDVGLFGFAGAPFLAPAGVTHLWARAYHPGLGRFVQADPILHAGGMNLYAHVGNDPVNATDPWGLETIAVYGIPRGNNADRTWSASDLWD